MTRQDAVRYSDLFKLFVVPVTFILFMGIASYYIRSIDQKLSEYGSAIQSIQIQQAIIKERLSTHLSLTPAKSVE